MQSRMPSVKALLAYPPHELGVSSPGAESNLVAQAMRAARAA
jgi:hypothetical protein